MSQFYSNLVCGAGCSQPAACVEWSGYEYPDAPWSGLLSTRRYRRKRSGYEYPDARLVKRVALNPPLSPKGQGMSTLTHGDARYSSFSPPIGLGLLILAPKNMALRSIFSVPYQIPRKLGLSEKRMTRPLPSGATTTAAELLIFFND